MLEILRKAAFIGVTAAATLCVAPAAAEQPSLPMPLPKNRVDPKEFGIQDDTITVIHSSAFTVDGFGSDFSPYLGRSEHDTGVHVHYYANLDIPAGAVIDLIGLNTANDTDVIFGFELWRRDRNGSLTPLASFSATAHDWDTDFSGPLSVQVPDHVDHELVLDVEMDASPTYEYFGWVEVHWHRTVSPPPAFANFLDVPPSHPFFQYIEAIYAARITVGCGGGNFCPDQPITRKQEAAFIAKALGLHWPN